MEICSHKWMILENLPSCSSPPVVEPGQIAVVVVSPGTGLSRIFASLGVAAIVPGGQTMNPSTQDILSSFENLPTDKVIILPNNKNIILAANQAKEVTVKQVAVVPTRTVPQGLAAMLSLSPDGDLNAVAEKMAKAMANVKTGEVTVATRTVEIDGVSVRDGQVIALLDGKLVVSAETVEQGGSWDCSKKQMLPSMNWSRCSTARECRTLKQTASRM